MDSHDTDTANFDKVKVQNRVKLKYKFYKAMLKVSSFWRGFSWSTKLDKMYTSEEPSSLLCHVTLANTYLKYSYTQMCR